GDPASAAEPRGSDLPRRLRNRLLVPELLEDPPSGYGQARQVVRPRRDARPGGRRHRDRRHRHGPLPETPRGRGGGRDAGAPELPEGAEVRLRPGTPRERRPARREGRGNAGSSPRGPPAGQLTRGPLRNKS